MHRANSNQSIRIRALEAEVARRLSETIALRDANHQLECELARHRVDHVQSVRNVHSSLEEKVGELQTLLRSLGTVYDRKRRQPPSPMTVRSRRPDPSRPWRGTLTAEDIQAREEGQLPALIEAGESPMKTQPLYDQMKCSLL